MAKDKKKETVEAPEETKPAKKERITQNGVTMPSEGTLTRRVWDIADELSKQHGKPARRADVLQVYEAEGGNPATGATQYGRWRKFYDISPQDVREAWAEIEIEEAKAKKEAEEASDEAE